MRNIGLDGSGIHFAASRKAVESKDELRYSEVLPEFDAIEEIPYRSRTIKLLSYFELMLIELRRLLLLPVPRAWVLRVKRAMFSGSRSGSRY